MFLLLISCEFILASNELSQERETLLIHDALELFGECARLRGRYEAFLRGRDWLLFHGEACKHSAVP